MAILFKDLNLEDKEYITRCYRQKDSGERSMKDIQRELADKYGVTRRSIRNWAKALSLNIKMENIKDPFKVLVYDIETSKVPAMVFWTGKTYITHKQLRDEPKIISISFKWLGEDKVHSLCWDEKHSDEHLLREFLPFYNSASMVVGYNNDSFDNKWVNTRAAKYRLDVNMYVKSFDIMRQAKRVLRLPSYSMAYLCKFFDVTQKLSHEGDIMWEKIQFGNKQEQEEYLEKMVTYNIGDIISTEELYLAIRKYMGHKVHVGVFKGKDKYTCPHCGGDNISEYNGNFSVTPAGTIQRHMICNDDQVQFKISNTNYINFIENVKQRG